jgi:hypothetical protein
MYSNYLTKQQNIKLIIFCIQLLICINLGFPIKCWNYKTPLNNYSIIN